MCTGECDMLGRGRLKLSTVIHCTARESGNLHRRDKSTGRPGKSWLAPSNEHVESMRSCRERRHLSSWEMLTGLPEPSLTIAHPTLQVGNAHQAFIREMRELEQKKLGEPRPATVPAMNVPQAFHVQRFFDRAAHHGEAAVGMRTRRAEADKKDPRQPFDRTQRLGHTQHRTEIDIDARMDDVWGAFHMGRGLKQGQLAGSNYIEKYHGDTEVKVYVGNLSKDADMNELKEMLGLNKQEIILSDPQAAAASKLFWFERPRESNFCLLVTRDAKLAGRVVKYCKSKSCKLRGHLLRVDFVHRGEHNMRWTEGHRPEGADWAHEHKQVDSKMVDKNRSMSSKSKAYGLMCSEYQRNFSGGLMYDINGIDRFLKKHPAASMAYPSVAEGRRRGAPQHGLMQWYPWMPAWEKGAPLRRMDWIPTPSFPGGGEVEMPMNKERMRMKYRYPDDREAGK
uniref:Uncharacterized protein n=1 Tax=Guillardia theta TaxID=55529 RepID=A0A7S4PM26_GUITH